MNFSNYSLIFRSIFFYQFVSKLYHQLALLFVSLLMYDTYLYLRQINQYKYISKGTAEWPKTAVVYP